MILTARPAMAADVVEFYGGPLAPTVRAMVWELDGKPVAFAGVLSFETGPVLVAIFRASIKGFRRRLLVDGRAFISAAAHRGTMAIADAAVPGSDTLLLHLGFVLVSQSPAGGVYRYEGV